MDNNNKHLLHDNGSSPFEVELSGDHLLVRKTSFDKDGNMHTNPEIFKDLHFEKIFYGTNTDDTSKITSDHGCAYLLKTGNTYSLVSGYEIFTFKTTDEIAGFYSEVGPNDVMYPFAIGKTHTYLLWGDHVKILNSNTKTTNPTSEYLNLGSKAMGWSYIYEQWKLSADKLPYDTAVDNPGDEHTESYGVLNFTESLGVQKYKQEKYHISDSDIEAFKKYEKMEITIIYRRT